MLGNLCVVYIISCIFYEVFMVALLLCSSGEDDATEQRRPQALPSVGV